ncbi:hypothetical protein MKW98_000672 [Papaver atlanticum]|uniref:Uncharacterized protein n=1 Tax=Papaver atlanticum TaxID=357466 RepID=A0AAD4T1R5_9MAGN|nr:hypothetical protein MKW98_000672 [Papaver atlanticum]
MFARTLLDNLKVAQLLLYLDSDELSMEMMFLTPSLTLFRLELIWMCTSPIQKRRSDSLFFQRLRSFFTVDTQRNSLVC